jgi:hypothetical protein
MLRIPGLLKSGQLAQALWSALLLRETACESMPQPILFKAPDCCSQASPGDMKAALMRYATACGSMPRPVL